MPHDHATDQIPHIFPTSDLKFLSDFLGQDDLNAAGEERLLQSLDEQGEIRRAVNEALRLANSYLLTVCDLGPVLASSR